jgi:uncharacterized protein YcbX
MPTLTGITIYPVKSLDGLSLSESLVLPCGALANDRRWRLVDADGQVVNAKRTARFHVIRAAFSLASLTPAWATDGPAAEGDSTGESASGSADHSRSGQSCRDQPHSGQPRPDSSQSALNTVTLWLDESAAGNSPPPLAVETFPLVPGREGPCGWLSEALAENVFLEERVEGGFPDDRDAPGPTLISTESLAEVARWFDWDLAEARRRFRMNLELTGNDPAGMTAGNAGQRARASLSGPFWEDTLACPARPLPVEANFAKAAAAVLAADPYADLPPPEPQAFSIGDVRFRATGVCRRCVVPSRDSHTGRVTPLFRDAFEARRSRGLRADVDSRSWENHFRLGLNVEAYRNAGWLLTRSRSLFFGT